MNITGNFTENTLNTIWNVNKENMELKKEVQRLNNIIIELEKYIIDEINDAQEELNVIMQGNDLDYKNECTKEFNCVRNALEILIDKIKYLKENG